MEPNFILVEATNFMLVPERDAEKEAKLCKKCGGYCCKTYGCACSPMDFQYVTYQYLKHILKKGMYAIDHTSMDGEWGAIEFNEGEIYINYFKLLLGRGMLYIRARNQDGGVVDYVHFEEWSTGIRKSHPCALLTPTGCVLSYDNRPKGGRMTIPGEPVGHACEAMYDEDDAAREWFPYQEILYQLLLEFQREDIPFRR